MSSYSDSVEDDVSEISDVDVYFPEKEEIIKIHEEIEMRIKIMKEMSRVD